MTSLIISLVLCVSVVVLCADKNYLNDGRGNAKLKQIQDSTKAIAELVRNLELKGPHCRLKLSDIANEIVHSTQSAVYGLNQGIPSIKDKDLQNSLVEIVENFSELANQVQHHIHGDSEKLKKCLADAFDKTCELSRKISQALHKNDYKNEYFIGNQLRKSINEVLYAALKVKFQILNFFKSNKELEPEIVSAVEALCVALKNLKDDLESKEELIHLIQQLERVEELAVIKLENYVHINGQNDKNIAIVKEVSKGLSSSCDDFHQLTCDNKDVAQLKTEFEKKFKEAWNLIQKLVQCDVTENTAGELYLRSIAFDALTLAKVYEHEVSNVHNVLL